MPTAYFLGNHLLATAPHPPWWAAETRWSPSLAYLCPTCGDLWARVAIEGREWSSIIRRCAKCGDGSIVHPWSVPLDTYPPRVLEREAILYLEQLYGDSR